MRELKPIEVEAKDRAGNSLGFVFRVKPRLVRVKEDLSEPPSLRRLKHIARNLDGWSPFSLDGERYPFSQQRAVELMARFPYLIQQIEPTLPPHLEEDETTKDEVSDDKL